MAHSQYDKAISEQEQQWSKEAEETAHSAGKSDDESGEANQKHSHLVTQSSNKVEAYE